MASAEKYATWIVANADKRGTPDFNIVAEAYQEAKRLDAQAESKAAPAPPPAPEKPEKKEGFIAAARRSFTEQASTLGKAPLATAYSTEKTPESRRALLDATRGEEPEGEKGIRSYVGELLGGSAGFMAAPAAASTATALTGVGAPVAPFAGAGVGMTQYTIQNLIRQAEEEERAAKEGRATEGPSALKAVAAAVPQAGLDMVGGKIFGPLISRLPFAKNLLTKGAKGAAEKTEQMLIEALSKGAWKDVGEGVVRGFAGGTAFEIPQEIAQQALERWQAGLPLLNDEARGEYAEAAKGALVLGGTVGSVSGGVERVSNRNKGLIARDRRAVEEIQQEAQAQAQAQGTTIIPPAPPAAPPPAPAPAAAPQEGTVRVYHGADPGAGEPSADGGSRWFSTSEDYARNFRAADGPKDVWYVDIPKSMLFNPGEGPEDGFSPKSNIELPPEIAEQRKPLTPDPVQSDEEAMQDVGLTDEQYDAQQELLQNYGDERFGAEGEFAQDTQDNLSILQDFSVLLVERNKIARRAVENTARLPIFQGLTITPDDITKATIVLRQTGGNPVDVLDNVLQLTAKEAYEPTDMSSSRSMRDKATPQPDLFSSLPPAPEAGAGITPIGSVVPSEQKVGALGLSGSAEEVGALPDIMPASQEPMFPSAKSEGPTVADAEIKPVSEPAADLSATAEKAQRVRDLLDANEDVEVTNYGKNRATLSDGTTVSVYPERGRSGLSYYLRDPLGASGEVYLGATEQDALQNTPAAVLEGREALLDTHRQQELGTAGDGQLTGEVITDHPDLQRLQRRIDEAGLPLVAAFRRVNNMRNYALYEQDTQGNLKPVRDAAFKTFGGLEDAVRKVRGAEARKRSGPGGAREAATTYVDEDGNEVDATLTSKEVETTNKEDRELTPEERAQQGAWLYVDRLYKAGWLTDQEFATLMRMTQKREAPSVVRAKAEEYKADKPKAQATTGVASSSFSVASRNEEVTPSVAGKGVKGTTEDVSLDDMLKSIQIALRDQLTGKREPRPEAVEVVLDPADLKPLPQEAARDVEQEARDAESMVPGGKLVYQNGNFGLIQGYNSANGQPIYVPFVDGVSAIRDLQKPGGVVEEQPVDVDYVKAGARLTPEILAELKAQKAKLKAEAAAQHAAAPFVTYDEGGVAVSEGVDEATAGLIRELKNLLLPGVKVYFTTTADAKANTGKFTGPLRAVEWSAMSDDLGSSNKVGDGEYYVVFTPSNAGATVELLAHEIGHIHQSEAFSKAPPAIQSALLNAHRQWLNKNKGKSAREFVNALRGVFSAKATTVQSGMPAEALDTYWRSFDEWYADQVSRWATSSEKPLTIVDKFFKTLGDTLRKFFATLQGKGFLPDVTFKKYLDDTLEGKGFADYYLPDLAQRVRYPTGVDKRPVENPLENPLEAVGVLGYTIPSPGDGTSNARSMRSAANKAEEKQESIDSVMRKIIASREAGKLNAAIASLVSNVRGLDDALILINAMQGAAKLEATRTFMGAMTSSQIITWLKTAGISEDTVDRISNSLDALFKRRTVKLRELADQATFWSQFAKDYPKGAELLADLMHVTTMVGVDPTAYATADEAIANDERLRRWKQAPAKNQKEIQKRIAAIRVVYNGGSFGGGPTNRFHFAGWDALSKFGEIKDGLSTGQRIYKMAKESYEDKLKEHVALLTAEINRSDALEEDKQKRIQALAAQYAEAHKLGVYFPLFRSGMHWLKVGESFFMFDNAVAMRAAMAKANRALRAAGDVDTVVDFGNDVTKFRREIESASEMLKGIYKIIDEGGLSDVKALKDQAWQMYLMTLPEADIRARFAHRAGVEGFSSDALRAFVSHQFTATNQLARLEHASEIRTAMSGAYAALKGNPDKQQAEVLLDELDTRIGLELNPKDMTIGEARLDRLASLGNKAVFYWMLTAPKSALVQMTQLPIVGLPVLTARYGAGAVSKAVAQYSFFFNKVSPSQRAVEGAGSDEVVTKWGELSIKDSPYVKGMKDANRKQALEYVWDYMNDRGLFSNTYASDLSGRRNQATSEYAGRLSSATRSVFNFMTGAFHQAENISRQIMAMSAGELEYDRRIKAGDSHRVAMEAAAKEAQRLTDEAMFDYSEFEKPRLFKQGLARFGTQFLSYPLNITTYLLKNFKGMRDALKPEERREAAIKFFGTLGMTYMFAGATGMPLYSFMCGAIDFLKDSIFGRDDGDDDENPLSARSFDLWFRESFIPRYFGADGDLPAVLGLTPEQGELMALAVKSGPISALTGLNVGASTSLNQLWFRDSSPAETSKDAFIQGVFGTVLGPAGSLMTAPFAAYDDYQNGRGDRALEKLVPAIIRGPLVASRLAREGSMTPTLLEIKDAEFYTAGKLAAQSLGFANTEVADIQKSNILAKRVVTDLQDKRTKLLTLLDRAYVRFEADPSEANSDKIDAIYDDIDKFSDENPFLPITQKTIKSSLKGHAKTRNSAISGLVVDKRMAPFVDELMGEE